MAPFLPDAPTWLTSSAKKEKKKQVAKSPQVKMSTPVSKLNQSAAVSAKKKKKNKSKKKSKARAGGDLADEDQPSDLSGFVKGQSPTLSTKDDTFVTVEEIDPREEDMVKIKQEPMSPTFPKATNAPPLRSESRIPLPRYPPYEPATRSASPSPSSQLRVENPTALMSLVNNVNARNKNKQSHSKVKSTQKKFTKLTPIPNSTLDQTFPPTSPLNSKTPLGQMPARMLQFDSSPNNRFSPSKSNKCTPVPLPTSKGFPAAPRLGTPFRATAGTEEDPLTPADIDAILESVATKNDSGSENGDIEMHDHVVAGGEESGVAMTTIIKPEQHDDDDSTAEHLPKKTKKSKKDKKDKKRRLEESNALDEDDTITVSAPKKAKKNKKNKKAKTISAEEEEEHHYENSMELDGTTQLDDTTVIAETTQVEVDMQLDEEAMQLVKNKHGGRASETVIVSAPANDVEKLAVEHEIADMVIDESASAVKKKKTKKAKKSSKKAQAEVEEHQHIQDDEEAANGIYVADPEHDQVTDAAAATKSSPAPEPKVSKKGRNPKQISPEPKLEEQEANEEDAAPVTTASNVAATMTANPLLSIAKHFVKFDNNLSFQTESFQGELATIKQNLASLEQRIQANELRASVRQEILFNALKKVAMDVNKLGAIVCSTPFSKAIGGEVLQADSNSPGSSPGYAADRQSRSIRATTVGPNGSVQSMTPIPLPKNGKGRAFSSHHRQTPASGAGAKATGFGAGAGTAEARKNQDKLLKGFTAEMDAAKNPKAVEIKGKLCVKYADDLFKMF
ncbi:hypothetical protein QBC45DRAFT_366116 [Copromyces sp. CBS 386.78]|nr:hypothetical protein QBC45DRAFT_366116 [Copromyces sp. CBS 386.78]